MDFTAPTGRVLDSRMRQTVVSRTTRSTKQSGNILRRAELPASVSGNDSSILRIPPRRASCSRKAGIETARTMA